MGKANFEKQNSELARREENVLRREQELAKRQAKIAEREADQQNLNNQFDVLKKQLQDHQAKLSVQHQEYHTRELAQEQALTKRAEEALSGLNAELEKRRKLAAEELDAVTLSTAAVRSQQAKLLENTRNELNALLETHRAEMARQLGQGFEELARLRGELQDGLVRQAAEHQREALREAARMRDLQAAFANTRSELDAKLAQALGDARFLQDRKDELENRVEQLEQSLRLLGAEPQQIVDEIAALRLELSKRASIEDTKRLGEYKELVIACAEKDREIEQLKREVAERNLKISQIKTSETMFHIARGDFEVVQRHNESLKSQNRVLDTIIKDQQAKYDHLAQSILDKSKKPAKIKKDDNDEAWLERIGDLQHGRLVFREPAGAMAELDWLARVQQGIADSGMQYSQRLLYSFHTSLKIAEWSPLTVLSGVSGTGKSELPRLYSRFGGFHFSPVAVQPNWDSPQDVFGFFNYMDNRFNARQLLRDMVQSQRSKAEGGLESQMLLVLLDEMNLAKVELYLSELLSKWELRRGDDSAKLEFDLGPNCDKYEVPLKSNVIFAGTVNDDESTQTLSDKVLDRGNLLYFPRPDALADRASLRLAKPAAPLTMATWRSWLQLPPGKSDLKSKGNDVVSSAASALMEDVCETYRGSIQRMNEALALVERGVGHRVWQAIVLYLCNHPLVRRAGDNATEFETAARIAFEDQVVQRIVPKLRGLSNESEAAEKCLASIRREISDHAKGLGDDYDVALGASDRGFAWRQSSYLQRPLQ